MGKSERDDRDRGKERERDRHRDRDGDRHRDRERDRHRDRDRDRHRDGDRDRHRDRDRDRRDRDRDRRDRDRDRSPPRHRRSREEGRDGADGRGRGAPAAGGEEEEQHQYPTAVQVCNMLCEMYSQKGSLPPGTLEQCFTKEPVLRVTRLSSGAVVARGREPVAAALMAAPPAPAKLPCGPVKILAVEPADAREPSLALAFFPAGSAPGFTHAGLAKAGGSGPCNDRPLAMLLRARHGRVDQLWLAEDTAGLSDAGSTRADLLGSELWRQAAEVVRENVPSADKLHLNNYGSTSDGVGLGIGETTAVETFSMLPAQ